MIYEGALVFDLETNGLLDELSEVHCLCISDPDSGREWSFHHDEIITGVHMLCEAEMIVGHNIIKFDIPALQKVYPWFKPAGIVRDTLVYSRLLYPDLRDIDFMRRKKGDELPGKYIGSHSLAAWGHRTGTMKDDYSGGWETWNEEMQRYCEQDVRVTTDLWLRFLKKQPDERAVELEHQVATIIAKQERYGFHFDVAAAAALYSTLVARRSHIGDTLCTRFPPWEAHEPFTPKRDNKTRGYVKGVTIDKTTTVTFNPNSRDHIALKLTEKYGWKPQAFTPEGKAKVDEAVLDKLPYPEAKLLSEYLMLTKRIGQLGEGRHSWLSSERQGKIHGSVNTNGAVTGRMTHASPNIAQVPSVRAPYGKECRSLFTAKAGRVLVGCDADGLELRCLAGYMALYDGGKYVNTVLRGRKDDGTDMHSINARTLGCSRDTAKTWFYAFIYGAGDKKLGSILGKGPRAGTASRKAFLRSLPALDKLIKRVQDRASSRGHLLGLDGRHLRIRSEHAALNTLLQSAGAVLMKKALVILDEELTARGLEYEFVANVHDEWQIETREDHADEVGRLAVDAIRRAGDYFEFGCPLTGDYVVGKTWADTH